MNFLQVFLKSIKLPNKQAMFKLNRVSMDTALLYMFILLFAVSLPSLIDRLTTTSGPSADIPFVLLLVYFFIFYYLPLSIAVFAIISLIAYIGTLIAKLLRRKVKFSILWKMTAYTTTIPFLLYAIIALIYPIDGTYLWLFLVYTLLFIIKIITVYPKRNKRK